MAVETSPRDETVNVSLHLHARWHGKAAENVEKWGLQSEETLLLAIQEELGELTQAHLEAEHEDGDPERVDHELTDIGALLMQLHWARNGGVDLGE